MKKLIAALLCTTILGGAGGFTSAIQAEDCTTIRTSTDGGAFAGEICIDPQTQSVQLEGTLTSKGHSCRVSATGTIILEKRNPAPLYTILGTKTIIDNQASAIGSLQISACGDSLSNTVARFTSKVINTNPQFQTSQERASR